MPLSYEKLPYRVDLLSPFDESLPGSLPVLKIYPDEKTLLERYIGVQIRRKMENDSLENAVRLFEELSFQPASSYDLDEYTRFGTISETLLEFVKNVYVDKENGKRIINTYSKSSLKTLVLIDGIPVYDHEAFLNYNPMYIKKIFIYEGFYTFGSENFGNIVSFITREGNLPFFQLSSESQLLNYDFPRLPLPFEMPDYSIDHVRNSGNPDFRHTLYWNPFVESANGQPVNLSFFTSDLCGEFKVKVEGITNRRRNNTWKFLFSSSGKNGKMKMPFVAFFQLLMNIINSNSFLNCISIMWLLRLSYDIHLQYKTEILLDSSSI